MYWVYYDECFINFFIYEQHFYQKTCSDYITIRIYFGRMLNLVSVLRSICFHRIIYQNIFQPNFLQIRFMFPMVYRYVQI